MSAPARFACALEDILREQERGHALLGQRGSPLDVMSDAEREAYLTRHNERREALLWARDVAKGFADLSAAAALSEVATR